VRLGFAGLLYSVFFCRKVVSVRLIGGSSFSKMLSTVERPSGRPSLVKRIEYGTCES
jgi:hypothetical protein